MKALAEGEEGEQSKERLDALRDEFLAGADLNTPSWSTTFRGEEITPDALLNLDFGSGPNSSPAGKEGVVDKLRRIFWSIFR